MTLDELKEQFLILVSNLDVDSYYKQFRTIPEHDGSPHIEDHGDKYHFVVTERGQEYERIETSDPWEILYLLLDGITSVVAQKYELENRVEPIDGRKIWFPYQEKLLEGLTPGWGERNRCEHKRILFDCPFSDSDYPVDEYGADTSGYVVFSILTLTWAPLYLYLQLSGKCSNCNQVVVISILLFGLAMTWLKKFHLTISHDKISYSSFWGDQGSILFEDLKSIEYADSTTSFETPRTISVVDHFGKEIRINGKVLTRAANKHLLRIGKNIKSRK